MITFVLSIAIPAAALVVHAAAQIVLCRYGRVRLLRSVVLAFTLGLAVIVVGEVLVQMRGEMAVAPPIGIYPGLALLVCCVGLAIAVFPYMAVGKAPVSWACNY